MARKGQVSHIRSDNRMNFVGVEHELFLALNHKRIQNPSDRFGVKWSFNTPAALHHGGKWERLVGVVREELMCILQRVDDGLVVR